MGIEIEMEIEGCTQTRELTVEGLGRWWLEECFSCDLTKERLIPLETPCSTPEGAVGGKG